MKYIGALRPSFPVNDFSLSVYSGEDENGRVIYYRHVIKDGGIADFLLLKVEKDMDLVYNPAIRQVELRDEPVYSYVFEDFTILEGTYQELKSKLFLYLMHPEFNINARLIIASFFKFHGLTLRLAEASRRYFKEIRLNVVMDPMDFVFTKKLAAIDPMMIRQVFEECGLTLRLYGQLSLADLVLFKDGMAYIGPYSIKAGLLLQLAPGDISSDIHQLLDADISTHPPKVISMLSQDGVFTAALTGAVRYERAGYIETIEGMEMDRHMEEKRDADPPPHLFADAYGKSKLFGMMKSILADSNYVNREKSDYATW